MDDQHPGLAPAPLGTEIRLDHGPTDRTRADRSVANLVAEDLDDPETPSSRRPRRSEPPAAGLGEGYTGHPGYEVPVEPLFGDERPTEDVPL